MYYRLIPVAFLTAVTAAVLVGCGPAGGDNSANQDAAAPSSHPTTSQPKTAPNTSAAAKDDAFQPHFDGLYVAKELDTKGPDSRIYIRFFKDGAVCVVADTSSANNVRRWLKPDSPQTQRTDIPSDCTSPGAYRNGSFRRDPVDYTVTSFTAGSNAFTADTKADNGHLGTLHMVFSKD